MKKPLSKLVAGGLLILMLTLSATTFKPFIRKGAPPAPVGEASSIINTIIDEVTCDDGDQTPPMQEKKSKFSFGGLFNKRSNKNTEAKKEQIKKMNADNPSSEIKAERNAEETNSSNIFCPQGNCDTNDGENVNE